MDEDSTLSEQAIDTIEIHLKCSSLKVEELCQSAHFISQKRASAKVQLYRLDSLAPFRSPRGLLAVVSHDWRIQLRCVSLILKLYIAIKLLVMSAAHIKLDRSRDQIRSQDQGHSPTLKCINSSDPIFKSESFLIAMELAKQLSDMGSANASVGGIPAIALLLLAVLIICLDLLSPVVIRLKRPRIDLYGFIKDKHAERRRFTCNLRALIDDLFVCRGGPAAVHGVDGCRVYKGGAFIGRTHPKSEYHSPQTVESTVDLTTMPIGDRRRNHQLLLVEPDHLTDHWHRRLCLGSRHLTRVGFVMVFCFGFLFLALMVVQETIRFHQYRLNIFDCLKVNKSLSPKHSTLLRLRDLGKEWQIEAYKNFDGSPGSSLRLILVEAKLLLSWREMVTILEITSCAVMLSLSLMLYVGIYIAQYISKTLWLNQIRSQVQDCIRSLFEAATQIADEHNKRARDLRNNVRQLTLAYANFELFRREQRAYQSLANFLVAQMILVSVPLLAITFATVASLHTDDLIVTFVLVSYALSILNIYLITSAIRTNMALKLMKDMSRLVAYIAANSLEHSRVARLWSSQILDYSRTLSCFAPKLFGIPISYDKIINLNAYLLALWIFTARA